MHGRRSTPRNPYPYPEAAALCLSRKMVWESLWGREGRPHHLPLNVNYAFMTVFIGEAARHPTPPTLARARRLGWVPAPPRYPQEGAMATCLRLCGQSMRVKFIGGARTVSTLVAVLPWVHAHGERGRGRAGMGGRGEVEAVCSACRAMPRGTLAGVRETAGFM